jgi:pimeloyl-ACP methyl ester carboxylesterase
MGETRVRLGRALPLLILPLAAACASAGNGGPGAGGGAPVVAITEDTVASADGVAIRYRAGGAGSPALVFLHCWSCDSGYWSRSMEGLSRRRRVVAIDLAGHGGSGAGRERYTIPAFAADVRAVIDHLGLARVVLVGHSMSGLVAVEAARQMPDRVAAIIAVDTLHDAEHQPPADEFEAFLESLRRDFVATATGFVRGMFPDGADPDLVAGVAAGMAAAPPEVAISALRGVFAYDLTQALPQVRAPIRCLNGDRYPTRLEVNRRYAPQMEAVIMGGVGHFPMLEAPREFDRLLARAADELAPVEPGDPAAAATP